MDKYLLEILKEVNTIIIPGIGALTITNAATGEIMFMPYLKYDDGKLVRHIAQKENLSENDAKNILAKYVREIEAKLNSGESYDMFQFGSFFKNPSGEIDFSTWNENRDNTSIEEISADTQKQMTVPESKIQSDVIEETPITEYVPEDNETIIETSQSVVEEPENELKETESDKTSQLIETELPSAIEEETEQKEEEISQTTEPDNSENPLIEETQSTEYVPEPENKKTETTSTYSEEQQWNDDLELPPVGFKVERPQKPILEKTKKDQKRKSPVFYLLLTLFVLIVGGLLTVGMFYNSFERFFQSKPTELAKTKEQNSEKKEPTVTKEKVDTLSENNTSLVDDSIPEENESPAIISETSDQMIHTSTGSVNPAQPYHLIAGAFKEKSNAERFRDRLRENGNPNSEIIGEFDQLFIVSVSSHSSKEEAIASQKSNSTISKSWIFRWP